MRMNGDSSELLLITGCPIVASYERGLGCCTYWIRAKKFGVGFEVRAGEEVGGLMACQASDDKLQSDPDYSHQNGRGQKQFKCHLLPSPARESFHFLFIALTG